MVYINGALEGGNDVELTVDSNIKSKKMIYNRICEHITTVVHVLTVIFVLFVIYLICMEPFVLFTWHPLLFSIGWAFLMTQGVLIMSGDNIFSAFFKYKSRVLLHWILQIGSVILSTAGFIIVVVNKNNAGKTHFHTWHAILGLVSTILMFMTFILGLPALFNIELRRLIAPKIMKLIHVCSGTLTYILGSITLILSLYSGWFVRKVNYTEQVTCFVVLVMISLWALLRPVINTYQRSRSIFS